MKQGTLLCLVVCALVAVSVCAPATTIDVGLGGGYAYNTIQAGINVAANGDTVVVHDGVYTGTGNRDIDFGGRLITVRSANGAASTIVDCQAAGRGFYFHSGETNASVLQGFTVRNGRGPSGPWWEGGGAVFCTAGSPTIRACVFTGNSAGWGGAVNAKNGSDVQILGCMFADNTGIMGGGFWGNVSDITLSGCVFLSNDASLYGGGMRIDTADSTITNCLICYNTATRGGGIAFEDGGSMSILHSTIVDNVITDTTALEGGGILATNGFEFLDVTNCILWGNRYNQLTQRPGGTPSIVTVTYTDAQKSTGEAWFDPLTCIDANPLFGAGFRLLSGSPCVNTGTDVGVYVDLDGNLRPLLGGFDMGCYEMVPEPSVLGVLGVGLLPVLKRLRR